MDMFTKRRQSEIMARITGKDTQPEMTVRRILHRMGLRFRLHRGDLPGKPDIVLPKWKTVIFVHGCFWHGHDCKKGSQRRRPKSNTGYWNRKLDRSIERDAYHAKRLHELGIITIFLNVNRHLTRGNNRQRHCDEETFWHQAYEL